MTVARAWTVCFGSRRAGETFCGSCRAGEHNTYSEPAIASFVTSRLRGGNSMSGKNNRNRPKWCYLYINHKILKSQEYREAIEIGFQRNTSHGTVVHLIVCWVTLRTKNAFCSRKWGKGRPVPFPARPGISGRKGIKGSWPWVTDVRYAYFMIMH